MPYQYNIPQSTDQLSVSQSDILGNFGALGSIAGNTNAFSSSLNNTVGFNYVNFAQQSAAPGTGAAQLALYNAVNANSTVNEIYFQRPSSGTTVPITAGSLLQSGWSYIPSGLLMTWGTGTIGGGGTVTITYTANIATFPGFGTYVFTVLVTPTSTGANLYLSSYTSPRTTFTVTGTAAATFTWVAMGV